MKARVASRTRMRWGRRRGGPRLGDGGQARIRAGIGRVSTAATRISLRASIEAPSSEHREVPDRLSLFRVASGASVFMRGLVLAFVLFASAQWAIAQLPPDRAASKS